MPVTLINVKRPPQPLTYNLEHEAHRQTLKWLKAVEGKRGETVFRREGKSIGGSLTLMAKGTRGSSAGDLPDTILACEEIKAAIARGDIQSHRIAEAKASAPKPKAKAPPKPRASKSKKDDAADQADKG